MKNPFSWKLFLILLAGALFGSLAIIPYAMALVGSSQALTLQVYALSLAQSLVIFGLAIGLGLLLAIAIGLGAPILEAALRREPIGKPIREMLPISIIVGFVAALVIIGLDSFVFQPALATDFGDQAADLVAAASRPTAWQAFLASFYGGINEEILLRLFLMSLLAWLGHFISKTAEGKPTQAVLWTANILAAVFFGLGHLPATSQIVPLTTLVVLRAIVLNGLAGVAFGYLYMKRGLESAVVAHFSADIVLHVIFGI